MSCDYYDDERYCPACRSYVRYLRALNASYCARCGGEVRIYSDEDLAELRAKTDSGVFELRTGTEDG